MTDSVQEGSRAVQANKGSTDPRAWLYVLLMVLVGSTTAPAARYVVREMPIGLVPIIRFGVAGLCLFPLVRRIGGDLSSVVRDDLARFLLAAILSIPVNQTFFLNAARLTATSHVAIFYATVPMLVLLIAVAVGQERLYRERILAVLASVLGVMVIGLESALGGRVASVHHSASSLLRGDLLLLGAVTSWAGYLTVSKPLVARHGALPTLASTFFLGSLLEVPVALFSLSSVATLWQASNVAWTGLLYLTFVATILALGFQNLALRRMDASQVATFGNAAPLLTILWGILLFGERLTPGLIAGGILTLGGILGAGRQRPVEVRTGPAD